MPLKTQIIWYNFYKSVLRSYESTLEGYPRDEVLGLSESYPTTSWDLKLGKKLLKFNKWLVFSPGLPAEGLLKSKLIAIDTLSKKYYNP